METSTITMIKLVASDGYVLYDGSTLADKVYVSDDKVSNWSEITSAEAAEIQAEMDKAAEEAAEEAAEAATEDTTETVDTEETVETETTE